MASGEDAASSVTLVSFGGTGGSGAWGAVERVHPAGLPARNSVLPSLSQSRLRAWGSLSTDRFSNNLPHFCGKLHFDSQ